MALKPKLILEKIVAAQRVLPYLRFFYRNHLFLQWRCFNDIVASRLHAVIDWASNALVMAAENAHGLYPVAESGPDR